MTKARFFTFLPLFLSFLLSSSAPAEIPTPPAPISASPSRIPTAGSSDPADAPPADGWNSQAEGSFLLNSGNSDAVTLGLGIESTYTHRPWSTKGVGKYMTNSSSGQKSAEVFSLDLRADRELIRPFELFSQASYFRNAFAGFNSRYALETGVAWAWIKTVVQRVSLEASFGGLNENRTEGNQTFIFTKGSIFYSRNLTPTASLENALSLLQNLNASGDWRLSNILGLSFLMDNALSFKVSMRLDHLHRPVIGKKPTDLSTQVSLVAKF